MSQANFRRIFFTFATDITDGTHHHSPRWEMFLYLIEYRRSGGQEVVVIS